MQYLPGKKWKMAHIGRREEGPTCNDLPSF
jgi:hypothetical protein